MAVHVLDALARGGFEEVIALFDRRSGVRGFLGIHDSTPGQAFGGVRRLNYRNETEALLDCLRLAKAMSFKCALAEIQGGGAKMVLLDRGPIDWRAAYRYVGSVVEGLGGRYYSGPDVGTGARELGWIGENTANVTLPGDEGPGLLPEATAAGVYAGIRAALTNRDGEEAWSRRKIIIQGMGSVGEVLARRFLELGARVLATELNSKRKGRLAKRLDVEWIDLGTEIETECDVFVPCALGGILHDLSIQRLRAEIVCGAANNQLARTFHGDVLQERGVLYVPDFVVNSGAVLRGADYHLTGQPAPLDEIETRIGQSTADILRRAADEGVSPVRIAVREAERRIEGRRQRSDRTSAESVRSSDPSPKKRESRDVVRP